MTTLSAWLQTITDQMSSFSSPHMCSALQQSPRKVSCPIGSQSPSCQVPGFPSQDRAPHLTTDSSFSFSLVTVNKLLPNTSTIPSRPNPNSVSHEIRPRRWMFTDNGSSSIIFSINMIILINNNNSNRRGGGSNDWVMDHSQYVRLCPFFSLESLPINRMSCYMGDSQPHVADQVKSVMSTWTQNHLPKHFALCMPFIIMWWYRCY